MLYRVDTPPQNILPQKLDGDICVDVVSVKQNFLDGGDFNTFISMDSRCQ